MLKLNRLLAAVLSFAILLTAFAGCGDNSPTSPSDTGSSGSIDNTDLGQDTPAAPSDTGDTPIDTQEPEYEWASYNSDNDEPFLPKNIFTNDMYKSGIVPVKDGNTYRVENRGDTSEYKTIVLKGEFGKCYEIKFVNKTDGLRMAKIIGDPCAVAVGESVAYTSDESVRYYSGTPSDGAFDNYMYVCREQNEYLVIYTGTKNAAVTINVRTMLHTTDTDDNWWIPTSAGSITKTGTFGNYNWTSDQVINNLYEPYREKYPDYIKRTYLGTDQSGQYDMYGYVYTPESFDTTLFITGGMHGNEESAYFALAKLMQLISDATPEDKLLYTMREKVRFVVVPVINVWAVSQNHDGTSTISRSRIRRNSADVDLNRDFDKLTQQETKNVYKFFKEYLGEIDIALDFHNAATEGKSLYYNFINYSVNAVANYKTTNHFYHRLMDLGYCEKETNIASIPGSYVKGSQYLEGRFWNEFKVPTITVEHFTNSTFPNSRSDKGLTLAVENYGNFVIQNALFFIDYNTK